MDIRVKRNTPFAFDIINKNKKTDDDGIIEEAAIPKLCREILKSGHAWIPARIVLSRSLISE